jgi:NADH-quinone oxidoreductase subunit C
MRRAEKRAELLEAIASRFDVDDRVAEDGSIWLSVDRESLWDLLSFSRDAGFDHCSAISVTDWPEREAFELTYHLWSYEDKLLLTVKSQVDRRNPTAKSAVPLWGPSAQIHERELHELFGVEFLGNPDLAPLFLENWQGPPPFRKDFDWRDYVRKEFYDEADPRERGYWD